MTTACVPAVSSDDAPVTRLRLTRRGRAVLTTLAAVPLVLGALAFAVNGGAAGASDSATGIDVMSYTTDSGIVATLAYSPTDVGSARFITVDPGQTLWDLAEEISPSEDPRDVVADIKRLNALSVETLQPGQRLEIPADS
ncbi:LysM peptidoglycan-binding domain-containing protein [Cryobacterium sp. TMT1-3]|uniref:LysM peptidoglycan-binding domain-containing protein n=1 Tax=Cryobacterium luteum TaxID=1424661 RepID=A0A1H8K423_9MICO|nr:MULTISPECIES: LysM peptidoglycan-binding domain-containing protein [Cryobacterium]TFB95122.1 LysM peptidoglycan-binding domain-containing protein [Cryobacterium luteum]TFC28599.1 LysM peptidoglycan-binding domain-containing protein [Cryobacterium sp. TMT1-3]SEN87246.1 LysM domain-containing protein [Cryobacterium luteum]